MKTLFLTFTLFAATAFATSVGAAENASKVVRLASLHWPPYASDSLPGQGATVSVVRAALAEMGYELQVDFYPWSRTVYLAKDEQSDYAGYFPEYFNAEISDTFIYSDAIGSGPLGLVENKNNRISWHSLEDLKGFSIGVVTGYTNTAEFDQKVAAGELTAFPVVADKHNIRKVAYGRIDLAVIDENLLQYMLSTDADLRSLRDKVDINSHLLEVKQLYVCFKRSRPELAEILNEGLRRIDVKRRQQSYLSDIFSAAEAQPSSYSAGK
ncbi:MAG: ABC transporter [Oceanospirillaceae bacterium]|nr:ABC transporter [Oceanospirillaceae bacterium]MBT11149.1 ABC transporter [Oceanospirillaceae bacterium]|tara:strand:- start:152738 stop:153541 length:804 start_codon:yes stop_codon:yes gene_type:complete